MDDLHTQALQLAADLNRLVSKSSNREGMLFSNAKFFRQLHVLFFR